MLVRVEICRYIVLYLLNIFKYNLLEVVGFSLPSGISWSFPGSLAVKNLPAMQETQVQFLGREDPLEEGMVTHSSITAWRIPWTEEPGKAKVHMVAKSQIQLKWLSVHTDKHNYSKHNLSVCLF